MSNFLTRKAIFGIMKITAVQLALTGLLAGFCRAVPVSAQECLQERVTLQAQNVSLKSLLQSIERQAKVAFSYQRDVISSGDKLTLAVSNETIESVLKRVLPPRHISYEVVRNNQIILIRTSGLGNGQEPSGGLQLTETTEAPTDVTISGTVNDENGAALAGVSVVLKGTAKGTTTDLKGRYKLDVPNPNSTLIFSFIGYLSQEVVVGNRTQLNLTLAVDNKTLGEVVVVGYGTQNKRDITGSVASVKSRDILAVPVSSSDQILQGRVAGLQVTQASSAPGGGVTIRIRGSNSVNAGNEPLYVIDGFPVYSDNNATPSGVGERTGGNALASINTNDIESIEVLKDASATAIYGARGANGVILITTKRGKSGQNRISVNSYVGIQQVRSRYDLMNSSQLAALANSFGQSLTPPVTPYPTIPTTNTDWQKEVFQTGTVQNHAISFSGGNESTNYLVSGEYYDEKGAVTGSGFKRMSLRFNLDKTFSQRFKFGNSLTLSRTDRDVRDIIYQTLASRPFNPVYDANGNYFLEQSTSIGGQSSQIDNPVAVGNQKTDKTIVTRALGNIYGEFKFIEGLVGKVLVGADVAYSTGRGYSPKTTLEGLNENSIANISTVENVSWLNENTLTYTRKIGTRHSLTALLGNSFQRQSVLNYGIRRSGFPTDATSYYIVTAGANDRNYAPSGSFNFTIQSFFGRFNYSLDDKYLFTFTARSDGSSKFGDGRKYGFFPSGAFAWRLSDESFIKKTKAFSDLKLRTSYGVTGNQEIPPYRSLPILQADRGQVLGGDQVTGFAPTGNLYNPNLGWERTAQFDLGLDMGFWNNRLTATADYYLKNTSDLLFQTPVPLETGFQTQWRNLGQVRNQGVEFSLSSQNLTGAVRWTTDANLSINTNRVISLPDGTTPNPDGSRQILVSLFPNTNGGVDGLSVIRTGQPIGSFYTYVADGIWQTNDQINAAGPGFSVYKPGDIRYKDLNNDGKIDGDDRAITGHGIPKYLFGLNNTISYKNLELNVFLQGVADVHVVNLTRYNLETSAGQFNTTSEMANRWTGANTSNTIPRVSPTNFFVTNRFVEDGSFLRLRTVTLSYRFPVGQWGLNWLNGLRVYATGQNLLTFTKYTGFDPEVNIAGQAQALQGIDLYSYPVQKRFVFGLNLSF
ncbi:TonB-dependent receptor (plasmid) [Spirosoma sp. SC4-14]|uniref:SusC/RagA family TonB-linked outer membrane protein n=1 Tax=Spirosoma sp. SC4-14 TaxID=3128900 RepID=UPI0030D1DE0E